MTVAHSELPDLDWDQVRSQMRRRLVGRMDASDRSELDDLVQEGCIRLLRAIRREAINDLEAFITVLTDRTFKDFLRRRYRNERLLSFGHDEAPEPIDPRGIKDQLAVDLLERIEFVVVGIFETEDRSECAELARHWFAARDWKWVSERMDRGHDAIRKQWSRCLEVPKRVLGQDPFYRHLFQRRDSSDE